MRISHTQTPLHFLGRLLPGLALAALCLAPGLARTGHAAPAGDADYTIPVQVAAGTHLSKLAEEYCGSAEDWRKIAKANNLQAPYVIYANRELEVPKSLLKLEALTLDALAVSGEVTVRRADGSEAALKAGDRLEPGDTVITGPDSFAQLLFPNGVFSRVEPESSLTISYLFSLSDGKVKAEAMLNRGKMAQSMEKGKKLRFNDSMRARTPLVITGIRGTEYRLKADSDGGATLETLEGLVSVQTRPGGKVVDVGADRGIKVGKGGLKLGKVRGLPDPPEPPRLDPIYRSLPFFIAVPADKKRIAQVNARLTADEEGRKTVRELSAPAGSPMVIRELADGGYFAFFTVTDAQGFESREQGPVALNLRTSPPAPVLSAPKSGAVQWGDVARLDWLASDAAARYMVQIARDPEMTDMVDAREVETPAYMLAGLAPGQYYGRVQAVAEDGFVSDFSGTARWEQKETPSMSGMETTAGEPQALQWGEMGGGWTGYDLQVAEDANFSKLVVDESGLTAASYTFSKKLAPGKYHVRLRAVGNEEATPWTPAQTMTVKNPPKTLEGGVISSLLLGLILL